MKKFTLVIRTKNGYYLTSRYGYSKDINKARVYTEGCYWNLGPNEEVVGVRVYRVVEELP